MYQSAIAANRNVDTFFLEVTIACLRHVDQRCGLSASDTLLLAGDTDRTASDTDLDKVGTRIDEIAEAFLIDDISRSYRNVIVALDSLQRLLLPF